MRVVLQKVTRASVTVDGEALGSVGAGYVLFLGVMGGDTSAQAALLAEKVVKLRLFDGEGGKINDRTVLDIGGDILVVSQFTLAGRTEKGNRPDYTSAAPPDEARVLYEYFIGKLRELGIAKVASGRFGAAMQVELMNDGPVTLVLDR
ncbi:D-tyrosyl-tRNA(Tyr) deacylase [Candidatus Peregrinibacteria bacterium]|nr:D-tyrosyl-tRNA(Tyr) deacylase [Candidatus Peregrinibacteria bacterium]